MGNIVLDMVGNKYGRLIVICRENIGKEAAWLCLCDCGNLTIVRGSSLRKGVTKSCRCISIEKTRTHGQNKNTGLGYNCWDNMIQRCHNPKRNNYEDYGGRGYLFVKDG